MAKKRPMGVTIICLLGFLGAILEIFAGLMVMMIPFIGMVGLALIAIGLVSFYVLWNLWNLKKWAWTWTIILQILGIVITFISSGMGGLLGILLSVVIVVYLWTKKDLFK